MRHHGWQAPYHPLQVVVLAVFGSLVFAFYVFFVPFVGGKVLEYHIVAVFSLLAGMVLILYVRCAALNPADPGVRFKIHKRAASRKRQTVEDLALEMRDPLKPGLRKSLTGSTSGSRENRKTAKTITEANCLLLQCFQTVFLCLCTGKGRSKPVAQEDLLYCSLCKAEISKYSKHCRACDKCIEGFDHHCRWINNCIGKKNYRTFFSLTIASLLLLIIQWSVGVVVVVRGMLNQKHLKEEIVSKLGSSFSFIPFIALVGICTAIALLATFPLGQLFLFHIILTSKGMSTYDYIVAMRELDQHESPEGDTASNPSSPSSSFATAVTNHAGALRTAARSLSVTDIEVEGKATTASQQPEEIKKKKRPVKISAWKLAQLNSEDACRAAARARERSTIYMPINAEKLITETDSSFGSGSSAAEIIPTSTTGKPERHFDSSDYLFRDQFPLTNVHMETDIEAPYPNFREGDEDHSFRRGKQIAEAIVPLEMEARSAFRQRFLEDDYRYRISSMQAGLSANHLSHLDPAFLQGSPSEPSKSWLPRSASDGYEASGGESTDDNEHSHRRSNTWRKLKSNATSINSRLSGVAQKWNSRSQERQDVIILHGETSKLGGESNSSPSQFDSPGRDSDLSGTRDTNLGIRNLKGTSSTSTAQEDAFLSFNSKSTSVKSLRSGA